MNFWTKIKWRGFILILLILAACSPSPTIDEQLPPLHGTNPFEQADSDGGVRLGGYGAGLIDVDPLQGEPLLYSGEPIHLSYFLQGTGSETEVGLMLFLDGVLQPHQIVKTNQQGDAPPPAQEMVMSKHRVSGDGRIEFTVAFTPLTGAAGDEFGLNAIFLFEPSFSPDTESQTFGVYHDGRFQIPLRVIMNTSAYQQAEYYAGDVETMPIPQSEKNSDELNPSGRISQPHFLFYAGDSYYPNKLIANNGQIELTASIYGGIEAAYRVTVFLNHQPIKIAGHPHFIITTHYDQVSTYRFTLDVHDYGRLNSLYAVMVPVGQIYKDNDIYGVKTSSILLLNDVAGAAVPSKETPISTGGVVAAAAPIADADLTDLLMGNKIFPRYSKLIVRYETDNKLLVWSDTAALFDLDSKALLRKKELVTSLSNQEVIFAENIIGVFSKDPDCLECSTRLERYDGEFTLIDSVDLSQLLALKAHLLSPSQCALSQSGQKIACLKAETDQVMIYNFQSQEQMPAFDFSTSNRIDFRGISRLAFAGNDRYLAFVAQESSGCGFGILDLEREQLVDYKKWDSIHETDIQTTKNAVYFHEQWKGPGFPPSGKFFKFDLAMLQMQEIQLADKKESQYVTISPTGKYIATVVNTAPPGAAYTAGSIKVYDAQTMTLARQIDLERGFPDLAFDETNRSLFAWFWVDENIIKLIRYVF